MCGRCSGGMPGPVSRTTKIASSPVASALIVSRPPAGVCRSAFAARFCSACSSFCASPSTERSGGRTSTSSAIWRSRIVGPWRSAIRPNNSRTGTSSIVSVPPPPSSRARSRRSPISASSFCVSSPMMPRYLLPRLAVERDLRHRQRFRVAANRGERRHELVRHVRQELTACAIGCRQRCRARAEIVGHPVERVRERADLVASALRPRARSCCPCPRSRAACSSVRSRRCDGPKMRSAALAAPAARSASATHASVGPTSRIATKTGGAAIGTTTTPTSSSATTIGALSDPLGGPFGGGFVPRAAATAEVRRGPHR